MSRSFLPYNDNAIFRCVPNCWFPTQRHSVHICEAAQRRSRICRSWTKWSACWRESFLSWVILLSNSSMSKPLHRMHWMYWCLQTGQSDHSTGLHLEHGHNCLCHCLCCSRLQAIRQEDFGSHSSLLAIPEYVWFIDSLRNSHWIVLLPENLNLIKRSFDNDKNFILQKPRIPIVQRSVNRCTLCRVTINLQSDLFRRPAVSLLRLRPHSGRRRGSREMPQACHSAPVQSQRQDYRHRGCDSSEVSKRDKPDEWSGMQRYIDIDMERGKMNIFADGTETMCSFCWNSSRAATIRIFVWRRSLRLVSVQRNAEMRELIVLQAISALNTRNISAGTKSRTSTWPSCSRRIRISSHSKFRWDNLKKEKKTWNAISGIAQFGTVSVLWREENHQEQWRM